MISTLMVTTDNGQVLHINSRSLREMLPFVLAWRENGLTYECRLAQPRALQLAVVNGETLEFYEHLAMTHTDETGIHWERGVTMSWNAAFELANLLNVQPGKFAGTAFVQ